MRDRRGETRRLRERGLCPSCYKPHTTGSSLCDGCSEAKARSSKRASSKRTARRTEAGLPSKFDLWSEMIARRKAKRHLALYGDVLARAERFMRWTA